MAGFRGVFYSKDGGATWQRQPVTLGLLSRWTTTAAVLNTGWVAWANRASAIIRTDEGLAVGAAESKEWKKINTPLLQNLNPIVFVDRQTGWALGGPHVYNFDLYRTSDGGLTWYLIHSRISNDNLVGFFATSVKEAWVVGEQGVLLHTGDGGRTWSRRVLNSGQGEIRSIRFAGSAIGWLFGSIGLYLTTDSGNKWKKLDLPFKVGLQTVYFADAKEGWAVGGRYKENAIIFHTCDGGKNWRFIDSGTRERFLDIQGLANGRAWAVTEDGSALHTKNHGLTWFTIKLE